LTGLSYLGFIKKTHGFKGVVKIWIENTELKHLPKEPLMLEINKKVVPFFIENISKTDNEWQVKFEDIRSMEEAEDIVGLSVYLESGNESEEQLWVNDTIGYAIVDMHLGEIGKVIDHIERTGQDLLEISFQSKTYYIPFVDEMITDVDNEKHILFTNLPEGLIQINE
jgi:16S rRNA processing protein RimM